MSIHKSIIILLATLVFITKGFAGGLTARINTDTVTESDNFQLVLSIDGDAESPDLTPLQSDFNVLGTSRSTGVQIIDGRVTRHSEWAVSLSPKRTGALNIPSIKAGKFSSDALSIHVVDASQAPKQQGAGDGISITTRINGTGEKFYVFQEIPITIRIETSRPILSANIFPPQIAGVEFTQTGRDRKSKLTKNGRIINVVEYDYIVRAEKAGDIEIDPFVLKGQVPDNQQRRDPFTEFDSMFGGRSPFGGQQARGKPFVVRGNSLTLNIEGNVNTNSNEWFLPAKSVELQSNWQPNYPIFKQGEAVTRIVSLIATGARPEQLPKLNFETTDGVKIYVDNDKTSMMPDNGKGLQALRKVTLSIVPIRSGQVTLPEINVKWLNTQTNQTKVATLSSEVIQVTTEISTEKKKEKDNSTTVTNMSEIETPESDNQVATPASLSFIEQYGIWLLIAILLIVLFAILAVLALLRIVKSKNTSDDKQTKHIARLKYLRLQLDCALKACDEKEIYQALMDWGIQDVTLKENEHITLLFQQLEDRLYCSKTSSMAINFKKAKKHINQHWGGLGKKISKHNAKILPKLYAFEK